jgi:hypothetical protein
VTTPTIDPMLKLVRRFGAEVAWLFGRFLTDVPAHVPVRSSSSKRRMWTDY